MRPCSSALSCRWILLAIAGAGLLVAAPRADNWDALGRLDSGTAIEVVTTANRQDGRFVSASTESLMIRTVQGEQRFARPEVVRVTLRGRNHRKRNILIGAGVGLAISIATDATIGAYLRNESNPAIARPLIWTVPIAAGAGIGAIAGAEAVVYRK